MSFDGHFGLDFSHVPTLDEIQQLAAAYLPDDVTLPTVPDFSHIGDDLPTFEHDGGHEASIQASSAKISLNHHDSFDFSKVTPHVVKDSGPGWSTTKITWNEDSSTHTGPGSSSWSSSSSSADASTVPGPTVAQTQRDR